MIAATPLIPVLPRWRLLAWAARAWRRMSWRQVVLALLLQIGRDVFGPLGGIFFLPVPTPWDPLTKYLDGSWLVGSLPIVYCVMVANEAFDDGVPPLRAYGLAVIAFSVVVPVAGWVLAGHFGWDEEAAPAIAWWAQFMLFQGGLGTSIYAYWRVTQRSTRQAQAAETERMRNEQRVQTSRLLALQSRVEPQMLFDSLGRIAALHLREPEAADALLADLIALLRAMQPRHAADNSTVEREFALVEAWIRVNHGAASGATRLRLEMTADVGALGIAPMLVLPLVRAALASRRAQEVEWVLGAHTAAARLIVTLRPTSAVDLASIAASQDIASLHERLLQLFGRTAGLAVLPHIPSLTLDVPRQQEDFDDDRPDR